MSSRKDALRPYFDGFRDTRSRPPVNLISPVESCVVPVRAQGGEAANRTWLALLRGVNVGGRGTLPMAELRALMAGVGCADVRTYVQSGNAVFTARTDDREALAARIAAAVEGARGFRPAVMLLTAAELAAAVRDNPFPEATKAPTALHLLFLSAAPERPDTGAMEAAAAKGNERFALRDRVLYLWCPDGIGRSTLAVVAGRAIRPVEATARNWRTVERLGALLAESPRPEADGP